MIFSAERSTVPGVLQSHRQRTQPVERMSVVRPFANFSVIDPAVNPVL